MASASTPVLQALPQRFVADSAAEAVARIKATLGPEAVVLSVRKIPKSGLGRLLGRDQIEVMAHVPEAEPDLPTRSELAELHSQVAQLRQLLPSLVQTPAPAAERPSPLRSEALPSPPPQPSPRWTAAYGGWKVATILEQQGLLPETVREVIKQLQQRHGSEPPAALSREMDWAASVLVAGSRFADPASFDSGVHVLIGPAGSGKTTCLCKRLAQAALLEERPAHVYRLDTGTSNTAEQLSVYAEILGVGVSRIRPDPQKELPSSANLVLVDVPGFAANDPDAGRGLSHVLEAFPEARLHLVLNAAYDSSLLMAQARAYARFGYGDIILTHLDEETRWGKIWNLAFGTNFLVGRLGAGQNIPGTLVAASGQKIINSQVAR